MQPDVMVFLEDILESANRIKEYISGCNAYYVFASNRMMLDAVERRLSIIGEALYQSNKSNQNLPITDKQKIIGLQHILVHEYHRAEPDRLWMLCHKPLNVLIEEVEQIIIDNKPA